MKKKSQVDLEISTTRTNFDLLPEDLRYKRMVFLLIFDLDKSAGTQETVGVGKVPRELTVFISEALAELAFTKSASLRSIVFIKMSDIRPGTEDHLRDH